MIANAQASSIASIIFFKPFFQSLFHRLKHGSWGIFELKWGEKMIIPPDF